MKKFKFTADLIFWYLLYSLPVICYLFYMLSATNFSTSLIPLTSFFDTIGFGFVADNIIFTSLVEIFGSGGIFPLFSTNAPILIFTWFVGVFIAHLMVDFMLFIPRLCHKWLNTFAQGD